MRHGRRPFGFCRALVMWPARTVIIDMDILHAAGQSLDHGKYRVIAERREVGGRYGRHTAECEVIGSELHVIVVEDQDTGDECGAGWEAASRAEIQRLMRGEP